MKKDFKEEKNGFNVLVLGNGFDCYINRIKTTFESFFRSGIVDENNDFNSKEKNFLLYLLYLRFFYRGKKRSNLFRTINDSNPNWMDVEGFIKKVATKQSILEGVKTAMKYRNPNAWRPANADEYVVMIALFFNRLNLPQDDYDYTVIKNLLASDLTDFENRFAKYVMNQINDRDAYSGEQKKLVDSIMKKVKTIDDDANNSCLQILNFNYTNNTLRFCEEANVHGTLEKRIVIGYDSTQAIIQDNDIFELSKDWRKIEIEYSFLPNGEDIKTIIVYGHSLGEQDYPYFFELFDKCDFITANSNVKLIFCYSKWDSPQCEKKIDQYKMSASKLLNAYERYYAGGNVARNTIVTKLRIKNRLIFAEIE